MQHAGDFGLSAKDISFDIKKVIERSRKVSKQLNSGVGYLMKKHKVTVFDGHGRLNGAGKLTVEADGKKTDLTAKHIILASGARARTMEGLEPDGKLVWTYKEAMVPEAFPKRLLVIGSGAIGIEFASFYRTLGAEVTVVEIMDRVLPWRTPRSPAWRRRPSRSRAMKIMTGAKVTRLDKGSDTVKVSVEAGKKTEEIEVDRVILAIGITGNVEDIGIDGTKVKVEKGHVVVNEWLETGEKGVYAIGDLVGAPWLAHKAMHEGVICVEKIAGETGVHPLDTSMIPGCTYCHPQVASVGMTEAAAKEAGRKVKVGRFPFQGNGKAIALGEQEGLIKTIFDAETGELLGAHMIGAEVTELIQGYGIARTLETTEAELMHTVFPHPTL